MTGRVWKFGDDVNTDLLAPGTYMKGSIEDLAKHCLEAINPAFASSAKPGDVIVAGQNFGMGSSREQAAQVLAVLGIDAVFARSFAGIFYRNAFNLGLPALIIDNTDDITAGDHVAFEIEKGILKNLTTDVELTFEPVPGHLAKIVAAGGLIPYLEKRLGPIS